jgi:hypothetical protein
MWRKLWFWFTYAFGVAGAVEYACCPGYYRSVWTRAIALGTVVVSLFFGLYVSDWYEKGVLSEEVDQGGKVQNGRGPGRDQTDTDP